MTRFTHGTRIENVRTNLQYVSAKYEKKIEQRQLSSSENTVTHARSHTHARAHWNDQQLNQLEMDTNTKTIANSCQFGGKGTPYAVGKRGHGTEEVALMV